MLVNNRGVSLGSNERCDHSKRVSRVSTSSSSVQGSSSSLPPGRFGTHVGPLGQQYLNHIRPCCMMQRSEAIRVQSVDVAASVEKCGGYRGKTARARKSEERCGLARGGCDRGFGGQQQGYDLSSCRRRQVNHHPHRHPRFPTAVRLCPRVQKRLHCRQVACRRGYAQRSRRRPATTGDSDGSAGLEEEGNDSGRPSGCGVVQRVSTQTVLGNHRRLRLEQQRHDIRPASLGREMQRSRAVHPPAPSVHLGSAL
mmetsp:Transcript_35351/g.80788  ORF Transcript_35351/g.80788 Transcript_35351/m.80788 type:complete len:254 (-) Transcript_35351:4187-4948(-)